MITQYRTPGFTSQYKDKLNNTTTSVQSNSANWGSTFSDVAYLRYNAVSGTQSGDAGTLLIAPSTWVVTQTEVMYFLDTRDASNVAQPMRIIIPEASADNLNKTITFRKPSLAGDLATVYIETSAGQAIGTTSSYDFTHPSDHVQLVSNEFEFGAGDYKWRQTYDLRLPPNSIYVDSKGTRGYSSIQSAIDAIKDADPSTNPYTIIVHSGIYRENITLKNGVSIAGYGALPWDVKISPYSGTVVTWTTGSLYSHIDNVQLIGPSAVNQNDTIIAANNGTHVIRDSVLEWITSGPYNTTEIVMVSAAGTSDITIDNNSIFYIQSGITNTPNGRQRIFKAEGSAVLRTNNSDITMMVADSGDSVYLLKDSSNSPAERFWSNNNVNITLTNNDYAGKATVVEAAGGTDGLNILSNEFHLSAAHALSAENYGIMYASYEGTGDTIDSSSNIIKIEGFGANYFAMADSTATINSHFDSGTTSSKLSGAGTFHYVYTPDNGDLDMSGDLTVGETLILPLLTGDNTVMITDTNGVVKDTTVSITQGASGGSILNLIEFTVDPNISEKVAGDLWVTNSPTTSGKLLKYWDGTYTYSVEMSKE